jgi:hypothetical protein
MTKTHELVMANIPPYSRENLPCQSVIDGAAIIFCFYLGTFITKTCEQQNMALRGGQVLLGNGSIHPAPAGYTNYCTLENIGAELPLISRKPARATIEAHRLQSLLAHCHLGKHDVDAVLASPGRAFEVWREISGGQETLSVEIDAGFVLEMTGKLLPTPSQQEQMFRLSAMVTNEKDGHRPLADWTFGQEGDPASRTGVNVLQQTAMINPKTLEIDFPDAPHAIVVDRSPWTDPLVTVYDIFNLITLSFFSNIPANWGEIKRHIKTTLCHHTVKEIFMGDNFRLASYLSRKIQFIACNFPVRTVVKTLLCDFSLCQIIDVAITEEQLEQMLVGTSKGEIDPAKVIKILAEFFAPKTQAGSHPLTGLAEAFLVV